MVAPLAGAWIEIIMELRQLHQRQVAPLAGAWIEIQYDIDRRKSKMSLLSQERGLKYTSTMYQ